MFRSTVILLTCFSLCSACNNEAKTNDDPAPAQDNTMIKPADTTTNNTVTASADTTPVTKSGSDRDEHGCIGSAGYRWSVVKNNCIRIFESGIKLEAKDPSLDKTTAAFIVFSNDRMRVEMFLPTQKKPVIIRSTEGTGEPTKWASGPLTLSWQDGIYSLYDEGKLIYQGAEKK